MPSYLFCFILYFILYFNEIEYKEKITEISGYSSSACISVVSHVVIGSIPAPSCKGSDTCYLQGVFLFFCKAIILLYHVTIFLRFPIFLKFGLVFF